MSQKIIVVILAGFVGGVLINSFLDFGPVLAGFFVFLGIVLGFVSFLSETKNLIFLMGLFLIAIGLGIVRYEFKDLSNLEILEQKVDQRIVLEAMVVEEPDERENYTKLVLGADENKILVYVHHFPEFHYGDKIKVTGALKKPENINDSFDWVSFLAKDDIYFEMIYPQTEFISAGQGSFIKEKLFTLKENFLEALGRIIPEPNSAFIGGLTVGARKSIPKELEEDFRKTGIIHIVVLSGYNITIVSDTIMRIFSFLPRTFGIGLGVLGIILFTIMTGASATVVRASLMALLVILARTTGRIYQITWALFITGFLMVFQNPKILRFDSSFQLSFLATLALIYLAPYFNEKFSFIAKKFPALGGSAFGGKLREVTSATLSTQIFVLPLLLYKMGLFSLVALPVNLLILLFVPVTMFFGFVAGGLGMVNYAISIPFGWIGYAFTQYELSVVKIFSNLPFTSTTISSFPFGLMLIIYAIYAIIIYAKIYKKS